MITGNDFGTVEKERLLRKYQGLIFINDLYARFIFGNYLFAFLGSCVAADWLPVIKVIIQIYSNYFLSVH